MLAPHHTLASWLRRQRGRLGWRPARAPLFYHSFELPTGDTIVGVRPLEHLKREAKVVFRVPVAGKTVLDMGAWDGFFCFEAEQRGAARVHAVDHYSWSGAGWGSKAGFDQVHAKLGSKVTSTDLDLANISPKALGLFDVVLCLGILHRHPDPLTTLRVVADMARDFAVVETEVTDLDLERPILNFDPRAYRARCGHGHWIPNLACLEVLLLEVGFTRTTVSRVETDGMARAHVIIHAWK